MSIVTDDHPSAAAAPGPTLSMRVTPLRLLCLLSICVSASASTLACGKQDALPEPAVATNPRPVEVVVLADPVTAPAPFAATMPPSAPANAGAPATADSEPEPPEALPKSWTGPIVPGLSFAEAMHKARGARDAFSRLTPPGANAKEPSLKAWFGQAQALVDQSSRMYAASFHAVDAVREGRIDAIAEAAELDMTMARSLDDAGLGAMPAAWRSDPAVASTFEDIAVGPTRRWRDEARVLARQCIDTARETGVLTEAAKRCASLRTGAPLKVTKHASGADGGAPCACSPGDPLCSASLGGWCGSSH